MSKTILLTLVSVGLCGCNTTIAYRDPPEIPPLNSSIIEACPKLDPVNDRSVGAIALALNDTSGMYNECRIAKSAAVDSYNAVKNAYENYRKEKENKK